MPSQTKSWVTKHDELSLLHIATTDPRRNGRIDLAYFDATISDRVGQYQWCIRREVPYSNDIGTTLSNYCASLYGRGAYRHEPDCNYTSDNYYSFTISKERFLEHVLTKRKGVLKQNTFFPAMRYKRQDDWCELEILVQCKRTMKIKICNKHVHLIPRKLFISNVTGKLCIWPKREKGHLRSQMTLATYLLKKVNKSHRVGAQARCEGMSLDYRIRTDETGYLFSTMQHTKYHQTELGTVIEIGGVKGTFKHLWPETSATYRYPQGMLLPYDARKAFVLVTDAAAEILKEDAYIIYDNYDFIATFSNNKESTLPRFCAVQGGLAIENIVVPSRNTKTYERAINKGVDGYTRRAELENQIISEQRTSGRMFTKPRFIKRKNVYADTTAEVTLSDGTVVYALDCRPEHIVIGSRDRRKAQDAKPLSSHELKEILKSREAFKEYQPPLREDI